MSQADDLRDTQLLVELSGRLITENDASVLYQEILKTAIALTKANAGTPQLLDQRANELVLLATHGFERNVTDQFARVSAGSNTTCGIALKNISGPLSTLTTPTTTIRMLRCGYILTPAIYQHNQLRW